MAALAYGVPHHAAALHAHYGQAALANPNAIPNPNPNPNPNP